MIKNGIIYNNFSNYQFSLGRAKDSFIWDDSGHKLIDFSSGWNVANLGWNNREINRAIIEQAKKNIYSPMWIEDEIQKKYAKELTTSLPGKLKVITREATGVTGNIMAIKMARAYTGKRKIISFRDTFHGSLNMTLQLGYAPEYPISKAIFLDFKNHIHLKYPRVKHNDHNEKNILSEFTDNLEKVLSEDNDVAAFLCEPGIITGWGSTYVAPNGFMSKIRKITQKYGVLLIVDEVGTGFSRTGKLFGINHENIVPDIMVFAKAMGNGATIGATVTTEEIAQKAYPKSNPQSTFGWTPLNVAAAYKTLQIHKRDKVWKKAEKDGLHTMKVLNDELGDNEAVDDINGKGLEIGVHLKKNNKIVMTDLINKLRKLGLHMAYADDFSFQIMPPLTIERKTLDKGLGILVKTVNSMGKVV